jgi:hypothetical protein
MLVVPSITEDCNAFSYKDKQYKEGIKELQSFETLGTTCVNQTTQCNILKKTWIFHITALRTSNLTKPLLRKLQNYNLISY